MTDAAMTVEVLNHQGRLVRVPFAHAEPQCDLCQRYEADCTSTPEARQQYRRSLREQGWQAHTLHNYEVEWLVGLMAP